MSRRAMARAAHAALRSWSPSASSSATRSRFSGAPRSPPRAEATRAPCPTECRWGPTAGEAAILRWPMTCRRVAAVRENNPAAVATAACSVRRAVRRSRARGRRRGARSTRGERREEPAQRGKLLVSIAAAARSAWPGAVQRRRVLFETPARTGRALPTAPAMSAPMRIRRASTAAAPCAPARPHRPLVTRYAGPRRTAPFPQRVHNKRFRAAVLARWRSTCALSTATAEMAALRFANHTP